MPRGMLFDETTRPSQGAVRSLQVSVLAREVAESGQGTCGNAVARRKRIVGSGFRPVDQAFVVVAREEESAGLLVLETTEQFVAQERREHQIGIAPTHREQRQQTLEHVRVVVEVAGILGDAVLPSRIQATILDHVRAHEVRRPGR